MFIDGFALSGFRSFGNDLQRVGPFGKINLIAGQNNSGKSNILLYLAKNYKELITATTVRSHNVDLEELDTHRGETIINRRFELALHHGSPNYKRIIQKCEKKFAEMPDNYGPNDTKIALEFIDKVLRFPSLSDGNGTAWFNYIEPTQGNDVYKISPDQIKSVYQDITRSGTDNLLYHTWYMIMFQYGHSITQSSSELSVANLLNFIAPHQLPLPEATIIPAVRRIGEAETDYQDYSGVGIIRRLAELQNPDWNQQHLKAGFGNVNEFLKTITGNETARIEIPRSESNVIAHMNGIPLPLTSLGTGIHEVVIIAAAATVLQNQIICIEEPELHLHPMMQRKLLRYLQDKTNNQYFITTHSAHLLDTPGTKIFHVRHEQGKSHVKPVYTSEGRSLICADLGYRSSDLVQANSVVWVEGPSDRIYLNHWIKSVNPNLIEGLHYSVMFYGGRLLSHLTANDPEIGDFISLRRLNRYISILIDSDKSNASRPINATKTRVRREFDEGPGFAWVTNGREIENYIPPVLLLNCVKAVHDDAVSLDKTGRFDHCLPYRTKGGALKEKVDKVKVAHEVVKHPADLSLLDLRKMVERLVRFIEDANDF